MSATLYVINPNSTEAITDSIRAAVRVLAIPGGPPIDCLTLAEGPPGIQTQRDVDQVVDPLCRLVERLDASAGASTRAQAR